MSHWLPGVSVHILDWSEVVILSVIVLRHCGVVPLPKTVFKVCREKASKLICKDKLHLLDLKSDQLLSSRFAYFAHVGGVVFLFF
jgi:hypothetical protein